MASAQPDLDWQLKKRSVLERNTHMLDNSDLSDINFTCKDSDRKFYAHKYVLATSSSVFYAMFYGALAERGETVKLDDTDDEIFEEFLTFLYTDKCDLTTDNVGHIIYLAQKYMVECLTEKCVDFLERDMKVDNVLSILEQAIYFEKKELEASCWHFIERYISDILSLECFNNISRKTLLAILNRKHLDVPEVNLFQAVLKWSEEQCLQKKLPATSENKRSVICDAIYAIRYLSMTQQEFAQNVSTSGLFTTEELVPMFQKLHGVESAGLKWPLSKREPLKKVEVTHQNVKFQRFMASKSGTWQYINSWEPDRLCFSSSKDALFHGVRLFGNKNKGYEYDVTLEVKGAKVSGTYGTDSNDGKIGFDVMLDSPMVVNANEVVTLTVRIKGPPPAMGCCGEPSVERKGVTVTYSDAHTPNHGTNALEGQFIGVILSF